VLLLSKKLLDIRMVKQASDHFTCDLLGNKPGRPRKLTAKTGAQRQRDHQQRKAISVSSDEKVSSAWCGAERSNSCGLCNVGQLGRV
jgi:hypothetical protein